MMNGQKNIFYSQENIYKYLPVFLSFLLIISILIIYWSVQNYQFLAYDDQIYVTDNIRVRSGLTWDNFLWAWQSMDAGFWQPLTWLSLMLDSSIYGLHAGGYHWTNVILHICSTLLLFFALQRMTGAIFRSFFVAALFAVHPLHVESVAWIAERKDVLCGFFWMLTMLAYARYVEKPGWKKYIIVLICFVLGLMAKPMLMTLPVVLLILDYWPLGRFRSTMNSKQAYLQVILEKLPLFIFSMVIFWVTYAAEHRFGAISGLESISLSARLSNALVSYVIYIGKMIYPANLAAYYPHPGSWSPVIVLGFVLLLLFITFMSLQQIRKRPYLAAGWFWYLLTLIPVIGLIQLGSMARADRYTYLPLTGLFIAIIWLSVDVFKKYGKLLGFGGALAVIAFILWSGAQVQHWQNSFTLFQHAVKVTENNYKAHHGLGMAYYQMGNKELAVQHIQESLRLKNNDRARNDLGFIYMGQGKYQEAEKEFREAFKLKADSSRACNNLGAALASQGRYREAIVQFREALRIDPSYKDARDNLQEAIGLQKSN